MGGAVRGQLPARLRRPGCDRGSGHYRAGNRRARPWCDSVAVSVGGGGLAAGLSVSMGPDRLVVAVEPEHCNSLHAAFLAGGPVDAPVDSAATSALGASRVGENAFALLSSGKVQLVLVTERAIARARDMLWEELRLVRRAGRRRAVRRMAGRPGFGSPPLLGPLRREHRLASGAGVQTCGAERTENRLDRESHGAGSSKAWLVPGLRSLGMRHPCRLADATGPPWRAPDPSDAHDREETGNRWRRQSVVRAGGGGPHRAAGRRCLPAAVPALAGAGPWRARAAFAPRCRHATDVRRAEEPPLAQHGGTGHLAACHHPLDVG